MNVNPITRLDYPDPDVIRVEDTYYMAVSYTHLDVYKRQLRGRCMLRIILMHQEP